MLEEEEYASSTDESDDDYKPDGNDSASEVDTDDDTENAQADDKNGKSTSRKRKDASPELNAKKQKPNEPIAEKTLSDNDDDSNEDALWASFLSKTDGAAAKPTTITSKPIQTTTKSATITAPAKSSTVKSIAQPIATKTASIVDAPKTVTEIFEFAGEKIEVQKQVKADAVSSKIAGASTHTKSTGIPQQKPRGGLSSVLGQLGKPNKLSVLQKTNLDWDGFKQKEGIDEELQTHNKGRDGYLERQDFLQRTDVRQFEIEKSMRQTTRRK